MENATTSPDHRLRMLASKLLRALEALPAPETYADVQRAARALITVKKALDLLAVEADTGLPEPEAIEPTAPDDAEPPVMNRQMRRMAEALVRKERKAGSYRRFASG